MAKSILIGLTGNIGSGKSTAGKIFANLGSSVIDTDDIVAELFFEDEIRSILIDHFPTSELDDGSIDKSVIRNILVEDPEEKKWLENIIHPIVLERIKRFTSNKSGLIIVIVPLLFEVNWEKEFDETINIACDDFIKIKRVMERNKFSLVNAKNLLSLQLSDKIRNEKASMVITNDSSIDDLIFQIKMKFNLLFS